MAHLVRYYMYRRMKEYFNVPIGGKVLGISGIENFRPLIDKNAEVLDVQYPEVDMQALPYPENTFDFVISDQVIEHLENPTKAIGESYRVLKKNGIAIHTTTFVNFLHPVPKDFWRFSPDALRYLCKDFSEILHCEGWGNRIALLLFFFFWERLDLVNIPDTPRGLKYYISNWNEPRFPIVTWIVARK